MAVPYTFGTATASIPLSNLDSNFATTITLGNTAIQLGNTVTTLNNMTLANTTISSVFTPITPAQGGTGLATLTANNVMLGNGTNNVTFVAPGTSGNVLASNGTTWVSGKASMPAGSVLQVVQGTFTGQQTTTSTSFTATNIATAITPTSSTSKIAIFIQTTISNQTATNEVYLSIYRGTTNLTAANSGFAAGTAVAWMPATVIYLDSPATTSSTTYTLYFKTNNAAATAYANRGDTQATMILMEIAA